MTSKSNPLPRDSNGILLLSGKELGEHFKKLIIKNKLAKTTNGAAFRTSQELTENEHELEYDDLSDIDDISLDNPRAFSIRRTSQILVFKINNPKGFIEGEIYVPLSCQEKLISKFWDIKKAADELGVDYNVAVCNLQEGNSPFWSKKLKAWIDLRNEDTWNFWLEGRAKQGML